MCSLVHMVPFCLAKLAISIVIRTFLTVYSDYDMQIEISVPDMDLKVKILPSMICTLVIWILLSFVSIVLTFGMPLRASYAKISGRLSVLSVVGSVLGVLIYEVSVSIFVYKVYGAEFVFRLQLILYISLVTFAIYSICQAYVLALNPSGAFNTFNIAIRIAFNSVTILHIICMIIIRFHKPSSTMSYIVITIGLSYRVWVAVMYTSLLTKTHVHISPPPQNPSSSGRDGDLVVPRNKPGDNFYQDTDSHDETYQLREPEKEKAYDKFKSLIVVNYHLFHYYWKMLTLKQLTLYFLIAGLKTLFYLILCYMLLHYLSVAENFPKLFKHYTTKDISL